MELVVIGGAAVALPLWILVDAGSIKAPCQPESRRDPKFPATAPKPSALPSPDFVQVP